ncbi:MAG TPA: hypothetical protein VIG72_06935 [Pontibacter sp.]
MKMKNEEPADEHAFSEEEMMRLLDRRKDQVAALLKVLNGVQPTGSSNPIPAADEDGN